MGTPGGTVVDGLDDQWVRMPHDHDPEAVVKIDVFVAVDVPHPATLAVIDEHRLGRRVLEGGGHAARDELLRLLPEFVGPPPLGTESLLPPRDFLAARAEIASSMQRFAF